MIEIWHGICFAIGFSAFIALLMFIDRFTSDLDWKFWQWKRKNFKD